MPSWDDYTDLNDLYYHYSELTKLLAKDPGDADYLDSLGKIETRIEQLGGTVPSTSPSSGAGGTTPTTNPSGGAGGTTPTTNPSGGAGGTTPTTNPSGGVDPLTIPLGIVGGSVSSTTSQTGQLVGSGNDNLVATLFGGSGADNLVYYNSDDINDFIALLKKLRDSVESILTAIKTMCGELQAQITPETLELLGDVEILFKNNKDSVHGIKELIESLISALSGKQETVEEGIDPNTDGEAEHPENQEEYHPSGGGGSSGHHHGADDDGVYDSITPEIINQELIAASIGSLVFQTAIKLYETIGGSSIESTANTQYGLLGIEKVNDVLYYKLIDKTTGKIYYSLISDVTTANQDVQKLSVDVLHTKDKTMVLKSTDIGADNNFEKLVDADKYYLVTNKQEINGVTFATILDSTDGKSYYIPISDSVELNSLNDFVTSTTTPSTPTTEGGDSNG